MPHKDPEERRAYARAWERAYAAAHPEIIKKRARIKHDRHRTEHNAKARADYQRKIEENRRIAREYYHAHKAERQAAHKVWRATNQSHRKSYQKTYRLAHIDEGRAAQHRRKALKLRASINDLTGAQWKEIKEHYGHRCVYCGKKSQRLTQDHITPLSKGGNHTASNVVPACRSCNSSKKAGPPLRPVQPLMFTIAPARKAKKVIDMLVHSQGLGGADDGC